MPVNNIVINTSPLILLFNSDLAFILPAMFNEIVVPDAVWNEIVNSKSYDIAKQSLPDASWIKTVSATPVKEVVRQRLGKGETEVIGFAFKNRDYTPMLDDKAAKKCSMALGLHTLGTGSVLILAKENGIIDSVEKCLIKLRHSGMWISDEIIHLLKRKAGE